MPHKDPEENRAYKRKWYAKNRDRVSKNVRRNNDRYREQALAHMRAVKNKPCADCREKYPHYVMDFDHVRGEKKGNVATMASHGYSIKVLDEEMAKCDVVCANCHRERTWQAQVAQSEEALVSKTRC